MATASISADAQYTLIETMPGVGDAGQSVDFPDYITGLYNFALAFVIVSALLMITIGGFYYIVSAGNQAQAGTAKKIITDALIGLIVVFVTWLVLYTINPDLLKTTPDLSSLQATQTFSTQNVQNVVGPSGRGNPESNTIKPRPITSVVGADGKQYPSEQACRDAGSPTCTSSQEYYKDSQMYLAQKMPDGSTRYVTPQNPDACSQAGACMSGADIKKQEMYNTTTSTQAVDALNAVGIRSTDATRETVGMGKHTQDTLNAAVAVAKDACGPQGCSGMRAVGAAKDGQQNMVLTYDNIQKDAQFANNVGRDAILVTDNIDNLPKSPSTGTRADTFRTYVYPEGHELAGQTVTHTVTKEYQKTGLFSGEWKDVNSQITIFATKSAPPTQNDDLGADDSFELDDPFAS